MKKNFVIAGFVVLGLLAQSGLAELKTRNEHKQSQAYLPPRAPNGPRITEEYITIHEEGPGGHTPFQESNYVGGKYEIFEIHNHYEPSLASGAAAHSNFNAPGYLPPHNVAPVSSPARIPVHFPSSYQHGQSHSGHSGGHTGGVQEEIIRVEDFHVSQLQNSAHQQTGFRAPDYLPPHHDHHHQQHTQSHQHHSQSHQQEGAQFAGLDYLPPHEHHPQSQPVSHHPQSNSFAHQQQGTQFKGPCNGPDYLPPHQEHHYETSHQHVEQHQHISQQVSHSKNFKGSDYLPPHKSQQDHHHDSHHQVQHQQNNFKGPDYLPPFQQQQNHHIQVQPQVQKQHQQIAFNGPDYLPTHQEHRSLHQQVQQLFSQQPTSYKGTDYLPPHGLQQVRHQEPQPQLQNVQAGFGGPDYLPPHQQQNNHQQEVHQQIQHHSHEQQIQQSDNTFRAPDYLPPHHEHHVNYQESQQQRFTGSSAPQPGTLPAGYESQIPAVLTIPEPPDFHHPLLQPAPQHQHHNEPSVNLPQGYDFEKPANAEQAIAELHKLPAEQPVQQNVVVQSQIQVAQGQQQADIIYGSHQSGVNYQANGYLPPHQETNNCQSQQANIQSLSSSVGPKQNVQQYQQGYQQVAPQTLGLAPAEPASNYQPPTTPVEAQKYSSNLHSISSYMKSVQPYERYASAPRHPFREYGPPPTSSHHGAVDQQQQHLQPIAVAPMYHDQASRSPHYAPAMSYASNSVANSYAVHHTATQDQHVSFNQHTQQSLQQLMPSDVRHSNAAPASATQFPATHSGPAVSVRPSLSSKIRTVQILNPAAAKTLKVLETSDHTGVKTIKILGSSNTQPTGEHHVVNVVSQNAPNAHEHVQTVKIFDEHEAVPNSGGAGGNAYLPPIKRVLRQTPLKLNYSQTRNTDAH